MRVTLEVRSGLLIGRRFDVVPGPGTVFGRSEQASGFIPHDPELGDFHFMVQWVDGEPRMKVLAQAPTTVNGEAVKETVLAEGDRVLAGRTSFEVKDLNLGTGTPGAPAAAAAPASPSSPAPSTPAAPVSSAPDAAPGELTGPELLAHLNLDDEVVELAQPGQGARELLTVFMQQEDWPTALRLRAHLLGPRSSVWWGILGLDHVYGVDLPECEREGYAAARAWVADPSEDNRRKAEELGPEVDEPEGNIWLLCGAAFWSEGSLSRPGLPDVPTDPKFSGIAVSGLLHLLAYEIDPTVSEDRFRAFLELGEAVERGDHPFPASARA